MRYLALGDSYTIGEAVAEAARWPNQLGRLLEHGRPGPGVDVTIVARTGWTTDELERALAAATLAPPWALVSLLIGVNDQYRGRSVADYRPGFERLLEHAVAYAGGSTLRTFVLSIPHWELTPFAHDRDRARIGGEIDAFNAAAREIATARGVAFVDTTEISRSVATDAAFTAGDGLHPSGELYARWAQLALPRVLASLDALQR